MNYIYTYFKCKKWKWSISSLLCSWSQPEGLNWEKTRWTNRSDALNKSHVWTQTIRFKNMALISGLLLNKSLRNNFCNLLYYLFWIYLQYVCFHFPECTLTCNKPLQSLNIKAKILIYIKGSQTLKICLFWWFFSWKALIFYQFYY